MSKKRSIHSARKHNHKQIHPKPHDSIDGRNTEEVLNFFNDVKRNVFEADCKLFGQMHHQLQHLSQPNLRDVLNENQQHELHAIISMVQSRLDFAQQHIRQEYAELKRISSKDTNMSIIHNNNNDNNGVVRSPSAPVPRIDNEDINNNGSNHQRHNTIDGVPNLQVPKVITWDKQHKIPTEALSNQETPRSLNRPLSGKSEGGKYGEFLDTSMMSMNKSRRASVQTTATSIFKSPSCVSLADEPPLHIANYVMEKFGDVGTTKLERLESMEFVEKGWFKHPHLLMKPHLRQYWKDDDDENVLVREDREHKAGWNELFFDLIFVVVFSHLGVDLETNQSLRGAFEFCVLFVAVWRVWSTWNTYINRYNPTDAFHKIFYLMEMIFVTGIVIHSVNGVVGSYILARLTSELAGLWASQFNKHVPVVRYVAYADLISLCVGIIPWILSTQSSKSETTDMRPDIEHLLYWSCGLCLEMGIKSLISCVNKTWRLPTNWEHLSERFGLMMIIMLGEFIVAVIFLAPVATTDSYIIAICGGLIVYSIQIFYFDVEGGPQKRHALVQENWRTRLWYITHVPLYASVVTSANGLHGLLLETIDSSKSNSSLSFVRFSFCWSTSLCWIMLTLIGISHDGLDHVYIKKRIRIALRLCCGVLMFGLPFAHDSLKPVDYVIITCIPYVVLSLLELYGGIASHFKVKIQLPSGLSGNLIN